MGGNAQFFHLRHVFSNPDVSDIVVSAGDAQSYDWMWNPLHLDDIHEVRFKIRDTYHHTKQLDIMEYAISLVDPAIQAVIDKYLQNGQQFSKIAQPILPEEIHFKVDRVSIGTAVIDACHEITIARDQCPGVQLLIVFFGLHQANIPIIPKITIKIPPNNTIPIINKILLLL
jgi:hypothetical protein